MERPFQCNIETIYIVYVIAMPGNVGHNHRQVIDPHFFASSEYEPTSIVRLVTITYTLGEPIGTIAIWPSVAVFTSTAIEPFDEYP